MGDLDNDGKAEIVVSNNQSSSISIFRNTSTRAGSISYAAKVDYGVGTNPISVSIGDLNNDAKADIAVANSFSVSVLRNISAGAGDIAYAAKTDFPIGVAPMSLSMGDCDGDGKEDLVVANTNDNTLSVLRNTATPLGNISFATKVDFNTNSGPWSVSVGDLDGDGKVDLAVTNFDSRNVSVFKNTSMGVGNISYAAKIDYATGSLPYSLSIGDLDGDGKPDLAVGNYGSNTISIIRNNPTFNSPPDITGFTPKSGAIGTSVVITGTSFSTTPANNIVMFGATAATVSAATSTSLTVTVPSGATYAQISVLNMSTGLLAY
ncbi:MAG: FG-GAP-like repeat-containing protein, partial [Flammeovirgaceae bacterium]